MSTALLFFFLFFFFFPFSPESKYCTSQYTGSSTLFPRVGEFRSLWCSLVAGPGLGSTLQKVVPPRALFFVLPLSNV
ncbi:hypothetical protein CPB84DRAFT_1803774, partial [Gymnopilus junonius]